MNYIEIYRDQLIPKMDIDLLTKQKEKFERDMQLGEHPQQRKIHEMICARIKELTVNGLGMV